MSPKLIDRYQREVEAQKRAKERKDAIEQRNRRRHAVLCKAVYGPVLHVRT